MKLAGPTGLPSDLTRIISFDPAAIAQRLVRARKGGTLVPLSDVLLPDAGAAYAVQDATVRELGSVGAWKVGANGAAMQRACAPLPAAGLFATGATLGGPQWRLRGVELEVAVRLGRDLVMTEPDPVTLREAVDAVLPVIEVVETRLADWRDSDPLAQLADLQFHGGLVIGAPAGMSVEQLDLRTVQAYVAFDGQPVASTCGANSAVDIWRLVGWLASHCAQRGQPLRAGQVITTGSCTGLLFAPEGAHVQANLDGIGLVELRF